MIDYSLLIVASLTIPLLVFSYKYQVTYDEERLFKPCEDDPDHHITQFFDVSNLTFEDISDEEYIIDGYFSVLAPINDEDTLNFHASMYKKVFDKYQLPTGEYFGKNFCKAFFDANEIWYKFAMSIDEEYRKCPAKQGDVYWVNHWSSKSTIIDLPDPNLSGAFRIIFHISVEKKEHLYFCVELYVHCYRI